MKQEIKPCPFCGGEAEYTGVYNTGIRCNKCGIKIFKGSQSRCEKVWNTRPDAPDGDERLNNEIINNQHKLMITAEQRGCDKTNQEWIEKIEKKIKELKDDLADQIKDGFDIGDFKHPSIITVLRELLPGKDGKT